MLVLENASPCASFRALDPTGAECDWKWLFHPIVPARMSVCDGVTPKFAAEKPHTLCAVAK
jgi:hypothetical protein